MSRFREKNLMNPDSIKEKRFVFLVSSPIITDQIPGKDFTIDFKIYLKFKSFIIKRISELKKEIYFDFDTLTFDNLNNYLVVKGKCKVCCLYFNYTSYDYLYFEGEDLKSEKV